MFRSPSALVVGLVLLAACGDDGSMENAGTSTGTSTSGVGSSGSTAGASGSTAESGESTAAASESTADVTGSSTGPGGVSYSQDVRPVFASRGCIVCHHDNSAIDIDIADPFGPPNGLVGSVNTWAEAYPEGGTPMLNVQPGDPEASFLMNKIGDPDALDPATAGGHMPLNLAPLTADELADLRAWIDAGAADDATFEQNIRPIFGDETTLGGASGKCTWCHHSFPGGQRPNLTDPFDPNTGAVGVASVFDPDLQVIEPGNADASVLVTKVEANEVGAFGGPMPPQYEALNADEIELVRTWVAEGAQDN